MATGPARERSYSRTSGFVQKPWASEELEGVFNHYDSERRGVLSRRQYKLAYLTLFGVPASKVEVLQLFGKGKAVELSKADFLNLMAKKSAVFERQDRVRAVFTAFDRHNRGFLTLEDTSAAFAEVAPHVDLLTVQEVFSELDTWKDGRIRYSEFEKMMTEVLPG
eukprot:RCo016293